jgi:hypothetical protein
MNSRLLLTFFTRSVPIIYTRFALRSGFKSIRGLGLVHRTGIMNRCCVPWRDFLRIAVRALSTLDDFRTWILGQLRNSLLCFLTYFESPVPYRKTTLLCFMISLDQTSTDFDVQLSGNSSTVSSCIWNSLESRTRLIMPHPSKYRSICSCLYWHSELHDLFEVFFSFGRNQWLVIAPSIYKPMPNEVTHRCRPLLAHTYCVITRQMPCTLLPCLGSSLLLYRVQGSSYSASDMWVEQSITTYLIYARSMYPFV